MDRSFEEPHSLITWDLKQKPIPLSWIRELVYQNWFVSKSVRDMEMVLPCLESTVSISSSLEMIDT